MMKSPLTAVLLTAISTALLTAAAVQDKKKKEEKDEAAIPARWEIYAGGGLYFIDRKTGEMWVYSHPGDVNLKPRPKYLGRMVAVGKEMEN